MDVTLFVNHDGSLFETLADLIKAHLFAVDDFRNVVLPKHVQRTITNDDLTRREVGGRRSMNTRVGKQRVAREHNPGKLICKKTQ